MLEYIVLSAKIAGKAMFNVTSLPQPFIGKSHPPYSASSASTNGFDSLAATNKQQPLHLDLSFSRLLITTSISLCQGQYGTSNTEYRS
jgi:hypothetical protein